MQTNVAQLLKAPVGSIRTFPVDDALEESATEYHVQGELTLIRSTAVSWCRADWKRKRI